MAEYGFARTLRLRRSGDFRTVQRRGRRHSTGHLRVCVLSNGLAGPRFGLTVSRKVGNAVVRNRVKRWLREAIRHEQGTVADQSIDVVFIAFPSAANAGAAQIRTEIARSFARLSRT